MFYEHFYGYVMYYSLMYCTQTSDAKEITNDVFFKFLSKIDRFDEQKPVKPWLKTLTINTSIDYYRKRKKRSTISFEQDYSVNSYEQNLGEISLGVEDILLALKRLPLKYKLVFNLFAIEGYGHKEIAEQLGISIGASKSNYHRARKKIIQEFESLNTIKDERRRVVK